MKYRSNLTMPELTGFRLLDPPKQIMGHDAPSDPDFEPDCTFWTHDEAAILYNVLSGRHMRHRTTVDIGARFGWTSKAAVTATEGVVFSIDPHFAVDARHKRFQQNMESSKCVNFAMTAAGFFQFSPRRWHAFVIDGNHDAPEPLNDAKGCLAIAQPDCIIMFHDGRGLPIRDAVTWLLDNGFRTRFYYTPNGVFCCWRGFEGWMPPDHVRDPGIDWSGYERDMAEGFDMGRCE